MAMTVCMHYACYLSLPLDACIILAIYRVVVFRLVWSMHHIVRQHLLYIASLADGVLRVWLEAPRLRACASARASLSVRCGRRRRDGCVCWAMPSASLAFALSILLMITHRAHEWMEARRLYGESVRRLRHCEYFNKVGPYCWRSNVLIIHDNYCFDGYLLGCGTNYNLSNMKAPCGIYFRNRLPYAARDIVKILTRDAPVDGGASSL